jgi:hypothetical protein
MERYNKKIIYGNNTLWYRPTKVSFPKESYKYLSTTWNDAYSWFRLSYRIYGTTQYYWLIMAMNDITNPHSIKNGDKIRFLLPKYIDEITVAE